MHKKDLLNVVIHAYENIDLTLGYPVNQISNMGDFYKWYDATGLNQWSFNNVGDPFGEKDPFALCTLRIEREVIEYFAPRYGIKKEDVWGFVTTSGTDGNNHGIYFGANCLFAQTGMYPIAYVSAEAHYSSRRLCDVQHLEVRLIKTKKSGAMDPEDLRAKLDPSKPALIILAIGSTFLGATDDQDEVERVLEEVKPIAYYRHVDGALFGGYLPFTDNKDIVDMSLHHFDSIAISGHKFFGIDDPCGLFLTTKRVIDAQKHYKVEYLNSSIPTISCSRSGMTPLKFYFTIHNIGEEGFKKQAEAFLSRTEYLQKKFDEIGYPAWHNPHSNTVFFRRPSDEIIEKYNLAEGYNEAYGGKLTHIVVMQQVSEKVIDGFIAELVEWMKSEKA